MSAPKELVCPECGGDLHTIEEASSWGRPAFQVHEDGTRLISWDESGGPDSPDWETTGIGCDSCSFVRRFGGEDGGTSYTMEELLAELLTEDEWEAKAMLAVRGDRKPDTVTFRFDCGRTLVVASDGGSKVEDGVATLRSIDLYAEGEHVAEYEDGRPVDPEDADLVQAAARAASVALPAWTGLE